MTHLLSLEISSWIYKCLAKGDNVRLQSDPSLDCMNEDTWFARGLSSRIDSILDSFEDDTLLELETLQSWRHTLGCDHDPLPASFSIPNRPLHKKKRKQPPGTNCGRWNVNLTQVLEEIQSLQDELIVHEQRDMLVQDLEALARTSCNRPRAYKYQDSPEIKKLIRLRKTLAGWGTPKSCDGTASLLRGQVHSPKKRF